MPELPEVEVTRLGLLPVQGARISEVTVRHHGLRWPIPADLPQYLHGKRVLQLTRRAKYILMEVGEISDAGEPVSQGVLLLHLGMSGRLCLLERYFPHEKHDHVDIAFEDGRVIRLRDPRRFGAVLWLDKEPSEHPLLSSLGPEPLDAAFDGEYLFQQLRSRNAAIKPTIMDAHIVVGVGNIYASESLFRARIHPETPSRSLTLAQCQLLVAEIKATLLAALEAGGSSLRDFFGADGNPGYFQQTYYVYGRTGQPCRVCGQLIANIRLGQRSTFYCATCQPRALV
ncbi:MULTISPECIES: bifunctional DNA-formamidopyrimidine glycosylase/DNA-(apurinic or apyrimidinic site) lyase [unclassified Methylophilus]|uniref:bifunctional DNA-formamidopyrimidine glycosylase/DNA-(apurinic or apyrimidinic site) lyase n=1 Tax=unclassified Methylophilus TaxID=2630143 RepID=UPI0006F643F1|nr:MULTISPECIES: bifunctional DNA-formamidopyrimidine glycosylase/DNA-(apurinic or apyrimidinic site) lyase [unclassified Methylophilus]KQT43799.1 5-hydroxymethyluracil DNA glycosylase [Methylophilus sp. Leaf416]KQT59283.1 5-hydroxymethyluracil DNA glycosylase [Methylophilus sp. Leaf459]